MKRFFAYCSKNPLYPMLGIFLVAQLISLTTPAILSWDGSVYAGMAKYLFSGGQIGVWETLRPVGFPTLLGLFWKIGFDPYQSARVFVLAGSLVSLSLVYALANKIREGAGVYAGYLLALTPLFFRFSAISMTDILSTTFALCCVYAVLQANTLRAYWLAGLLAGLAFLFRFPHGLVAVVGGIVIFFRAYNSELSGIKDLAFEYIKSMLWYGLGFFGVVLPFLIVNTIAYGDPLLPLRAGAGIIAHNPILYLEHPLFYFSSLLESSYLYLFAVVPIVLLFLRKSYRKNFTLIAGLVYLAIYIAYFSFTDHKEFRYMLAFLPMAAVFAGVGISVVLSRIRISWIRYGCAAVLFIFALHGLLGTLREHSQKDDLVYEQIGQYFTMYEKEHGTNARVLSAVPFIVARSNALIIATLYDDWRIVLPAYEKNKGNITHVLTDTCTLEVICRFDQGCTQGKEEFEDRMKSEAVLVQSGNVGSCRVMLYEVK